jgi:hypothetical protein
MNDLFDWKPPTSFDPYGGPGYKEHTTSKAAAAKMASRAPTLRDLVLVAITDVWPAGLTADEAAEAVVCTVLAVRPRLSELKAMGKIIPTAITRPNVSGVQARVMVARRSS